MISKGNYEAIEIPEKLHLMVTDTLAQARQPNPSHRVRRITRKCTCAAAAFTVCLVVSLNIFPTFAQAAYHIPIVGDLCRIFTFRQYHFEDAVKYIDVKIPRIDNTGKSELEQRVNLEIQKIISDRLAESEDRAKAYYDAFIKTGGDPEDFIPIGITADYEIKHISDRYVSFVVSQYETRFSAYKNSYYYNIDMQSGRILTLRDVLGNDYRQIASDSIARTIADWTAEEKGLLWDDLVIMDLISENTDFYLNSAGNAVVVFDKYEAAVGAAGALEFVIKAA